MDIYTTNSTKGVSMDDKWTNILSNLVLISNNKNVKLGNLDFKKKKE